MIVLLRESNIRICKAGIGNIDKRDIIAANTNFQTEPLNAVILGFNVTHEEDIKELDLKNVKILEEEVVYKLIEKLQEWQNKKRNEIEKAKMMSLAVVCQLKVLPQYVFHNSNPAIFGVKVEAGKLKENVHLINEQGEEVGKVKKIQIDKESRQEASRGLEVAISIPGVNFERQIKEIKNLYSDMGSNQFKAFKKNKELLSKDEIDVLQKIAQIKRKVEPGWGM